MTKNKQKIKLTMPRKINFTKTMKRMKKMLANRHTHRSDRKDPLNLKSLILGNKRGKTEQSF